MFRVVFKVKYATIGSSDNWFVFLCLHFVLLRVVLKLGCKKTAHFRRRWRQIFVKLLLENVHIAELWRVTRKIPHCWLAAGTTRFPGKQNWSRLFFILLIFVVTSLKRLWDHCLKRIHCACESRHEQKSGFWTTILSLATLNVYFTSRGGKIKLLCG